MYVSSFVVANLQVFLVYAPIVRTRMGIQGKTSSEHKFTLRCCMIWQ